MTPPKRLSDSQRDQVFDWEWQKAFRRVTDAVLARYAALPDRKGELARAEQERRMTKRTIT